MKATNEKKAEGYSSPYNFEGRIPLSQAIPLGLQHVMAMFIGNLTPLIIVMGVCGLTADAGFGELRTALLQNAMIIAGVVTLVQMFSIGPVGGKVPIVMGTSSGFLGVLNNTVAACGGGILAYGAIMGACIVGGIFESVLGAFLKPLRKFFPPIVTGSVVIAIGLSLLGVGINYFCGGSGKADYGSLPNLFLGFVVLVVIVLLKHFAPQKSILSSSAILFGILVGYIAAIIMTLVLPHTGVDADGVKYTYSWVVDFAQVKNAAWIPAALQAIFVSAFSKKAVIGGIAGTAVKMAVRTGMAKGLFTNEAGMGSMPMTAAAAAVLLHGGPPAEILRESRE